MNQREYAAEQAIASACIEGFVPDAVSMADWDRFVKEEISGDELTRRVVSRALKNEEIKLKHVA
ncbi:hypothetical protein AGMMS50256_23210 [Betaproteobacteria bacterium]|nr:hypothetical protein AGMMS50256_23210 [Betaproteobacteria bacterium]